MNCTNLCYIYKEQNNTLQNLQMQCQLYSLGVLATQGMPASNYHLCLDMCFCLIFIWACGKLSMQCKANLCVWFLCIDTKFWYPCPFVFKCTKKQPVNCFQRLLFCLVFSLFSSSYPIPSIVLCENLVSVLFIQLARFYPFCAVFLCSLNVLFCFSLYSSLYFLSLLTLSFSLIERH